MGLKELREKAEAVSEYIEDAIGEKKQIVIICHLDADGLTAGSIIGKSIFKEGGKAIIRATNDVTPNLIFNLKRQEYDFHIFADIGMGFVNLLDKELENRWLILDHHQSSKEELEHVRVLNPHEFDIDGGVEISGSSIAYIVAKKMNSSNRELSPLAVVGALADRQDQGPSKSLIGINQKVVLKDAKDAELIKEEKDLVFYGRETKPIHEAIASTNTPFIPLLTGNYEACLAALISAKFKLKEGEMWRTISELSYEEKMRLIEILIPYVTKGGAKSDVIEEFFGNVYTLLKEEERSNLRDAREFGSLLNACGRSGKAGSGILICLGDRNEAYVGGEKILQDYRRTLTQYLQTINTDAKRMQTTKKVVQVIGDGLVDEKMLGAVSSILSSSLAFKDKILILRTKTKENDIKISARRGEALVGLNLGLVMRETARSLGGDGGGHAAAAGAKLPVEVYEKFIAEIIRKVDDEENKTKSDS
ncbi:MAG: DHH family phosphoesterase [Nitrososphaeria archaeon]